MTDLTIKNGECQYQIIKVLTLTLQSVRVCALLFLFKKAGAGRDTVF